MNRQTRLGDLGSVGRIGLGGLALSGVYGAVSESQTVEVIRRALALGVQMIDTADVYGNHENERVIGEAIKGRRDSVVLATKFGNINRPDGSRVVNGAPEYVARACDASLERLDVDHIDLFYLHRLDKQVPIEETVAAMADLVRAGKVRHLGLSEVSAKTLRRAHRIHPITALQSEYSLWERGLEAEILPTARELGIGLVAFSPLGRGFLAGAIASTADLDERDSRRTLPRFSPENLSLNRPILGAIDRVARRRSATAAQVALAWVLAQGPGIVAIPGTRRLEHLEENLRALELTLTADDLQALDAAAPPGSAAGARYPADFLARLDT